MDSMAAFAMNRANQGREPKVFDWDKAARLITEKQPQEASAGLSGDWEYTGGPIYRSGEPVSEDDTYTYLSSTWATPELDMDGEVIDCFVMNSECEWNAETYWPESALKILNGG